MDQTAPCGPRASTTREYCILLACIAAVSLGFAWLLNWSFAAEIGDGWTSSVILVAWMGTIAALVIIAMGPARITDSVSAAAARGPAPQVAVELLLHFLTFLARGIASGMAPAVAVSTALLQMLDARGTSVFVPPAANEAEAVQPVRAAAPAPPPADTAPPTPPSAVASAPSAPASRRQLGFGADTSPASLAGTSPTAASPELIEMSTPEQWV